MRGYNSVYITRCTYIMYRSVMDLYIEYSERNAYPYCIHVCMFVFSLFKIFFSFYCIIVFLHVSTIVITIIIFYYCYHSSGSVRFHAVFCLFFLVLLLLLQPTTTVYAVYTAPVTRRLTFTVTRTAADRRAIPLWPAASATQTDRCNIIIMWI